MCLVERWGEGWLVEHWPGRWAARRQYPFINFERICAHSQFIYVMFYVLIRKTIFTKWVRQSVLHFIKYTRAKKAGLLHELFQCNDLQWHFMHIRCSGPQPLFLNCFFNLCESPVSAECMNYSHCLFVAGVVFWDLAEFQWKSRFWWMNLLLHWR